MKKQLISILFVFLSSMYFISCSKDFLNVPVQGQITPDSDPALAEKLVNGVYNSLLNGEAFGGQGDIHGISFITLTEIISDNADKGSTPSDQPGIGDIDNLNLSPTNNFIAAVWTGYFNGIARANQALAALDKSNIDDKTKQKYIGEVKFLRAYFYFNLTRWFGKLPKILRVAVDATDANTNPTFQTRVSVDEIYALIIEDLQAGIENLPLRSGTAVGRISKGTAQALLAKVYLYKKDWQKAYDLANEVINSGQYNLVTDYTKLWRQEDDNSTETIFEVQTGQNNNTDFGVQGYCVWQGVRVGGKGGWSDLGYGFNNPSVNLINSYEPDDIRKSSTIIFIDQSAEHHGTVLFDGFRVPSADSVQNLYYNYKAYHSENKNVERFLGNRDNKQKNLHLLRLGDVILMAAESANELDNQGEAADRLNQIRSRVGLANTTASGKSALREAIYKERRVELAMEHDRWFDLIRTGKAKEAMTANGKTFVEGKNELLPIPSLQIALSGGKLDQNPGY
ncbi:MAG TPA: RagB/SusD family nutrient uptake outer membrane protein [Saprospiraceae bacterium]|nr:RagB/SusD family nutrient uptake outer membrane protein [Saprospiraceae bacterium]HQW55129.1 RagB/SusD family nutrient uptake outer membrane protein [Saprospiraceae bacterium]